MLKTLIIYLTLILTGLSHAQQSTLICTPHLNQLVNAGIPRTFIFQRGNNYCAAIGDNSGEMVEHGVTWLLNRINDAFIIVADAVTTPQEFDINTTYEEINERTPYSSDAEEWLANHPDVAAEIAQQEQDNSISLNGLRHFSEKPNTEQEDWLQGFVEFWNLNGVK